MSDDPTNNHNEGGEQAGPVRRILALPNDSTTKTVAVALVLCLVCAVVVSASAVLLRPLQVENRIFDRQRNILQAAGLYEPGVPIDDQFESVETRIVDLATGEYATDIDPASYDQRQAARDPERNVELPQDEDLADIGRRARYAKVYLVMANGALDKVVLPVHGYGLWSTMYGFLALEEDANTIFGLKFYEHAETPGLGGEIDNPQWLARWQGKKVFDEGDVAIRVVKGTVAEDSPGAEHRVDGLSGATLTSRGVTNLLQYWLSEQGFRPYLESIRTSG